MKLRRAMATAAATAVIAPLALLSAPAAFADEDPSTSPSSATAEATASPSATESAPATENSTTPADGETSPSQTETTPADNGAGSPAAGDTGSPSPTGSSSPSTSASPSPSESAPEGGELCVDENGESTAELSEHLKSGLSGLPDTIVAGSGWTAFSFNVSNHGDQEIKDIKPLIGVAAIGWDDAKDYSGEIKVQVFDKATKSWQTIADAAGEGGTFTAFSLGAGQSVSYKLRLSVSGKVPDSLGLTGGLAEYADEQGCWLADDPNGWAYFFDILGAGSDPGKPGDAKPQTGGMKPIKNVNEVDATGSLAETGSSSALPMIGLTGGLAVALGAGAVFVVRRRKAGTPTA
ncbi:LAETG motif-containing sortase-dependent surface protein [Streptomyces sp. NPDC050788]|uniref:LAETG motif-containing sortase-dependent surface protein n=1 Tax=Streptomyces sp. NPDC050788 TaxID=3155041 RepID=UPI00343A7B51